MSVFRTLGQSLARASFRGPTRFFTSAPLIRGNVKLAKPFVPTSTRDLVSFKAKYVKPTDITPLLEAPELYARIHIHNWSLLVTEGDLIKLPVRMKDVNLGDTLVFDEVSEIGSRNYTLSGPRIDRSVARITGTVIEKSRVKREVQGRTRRRRRHVRHVVSNNCLTVIRVNELRLLPPSSPTAPEI